MFIGPMRSLLPCFILAAVSACTHRQKAENEPERMIATAIDHCPIPRLGGVKVLDSISRQNKRYTQGLIYRDGTLFESSGIYGLSGLVKIDPKTGEDTVQSSLPPEYFGEGLEEVGGKFYQLTWREGTVFVFEKPNGEPTTLKLKSANGEGWGLTHTGQDFVWSDGSDELYFGKISKGELKPYRKVKVRVAEEDGDRLNELEFAEGHIFANRYMSNVIVKIDPHSGCVTRLYDLRKILSSSERSSLLVGEVLNGIAYDPQSQSFFVAGKQWPRIFRVRLD